MGVEAVLPRGGQKPRVDLSLKTNALPDITRCSEWPAQMKGELCWEPTTFKSKEDFTLTLTEEELAEVRAALQHFNGM